MFLLGAVVVGGVLGFSADRVIANKNPRTWAQRITLYDELGITADQRNKMDSIFDDANCKTEELMKPVQASLDSLKTQSRRDWMAVMTDKQRAQFDARDARMRARRDSIDKARAAERATHPSDVNERQRRCGGPRPGIGAGGPGQTRGPGGPFFH